MTENPVDSLVLTPVFVKSQFQNQRIGGKLILQGYPIAKALGYQSVRLIGHEDYSPLFDYEKQVILGFLFRLIFWKKMGWL